MSREELHQRISDLLEMLTVNNNRLSLHEEKLSQLDIDVLRKHCIDLYDSVNKLAIQGKRPISRPTPVDKVVEKEAGLSFFSVRLWDANDLVEAVLRNYDRLPEELQNELPLKQIWALVIEEQ